MNGLRGYIFSRPFMGERVPQHVQNLVIRDYCKKQGFQYLLSATEYAMPNSHLILQQVLDELSELDGIIFYSLFLLLGVYFWFFLIVFSWILGLLFGTCTV